MNILDLRTVLLSYVISNAICAFVMVALWLQNRRRSPELGFWLAGFILQFLAILLIVLRGTAPDFISIVIGNSMLIGQVLLVYIGLERYFGKTSSQLHNYILLALFVSVHAYFTYVQPSLQARNLNVSLGLLVTCSQCAWLMLRRVDVEMRPTTKIVGFIFAVYSLVSVVRVFIDLAAPPGNDLFKSDVYDTLVVLTYQMLSIALIFGLFLMVNRRLFGELETDILERTRVEQALKKSEEKFSIAFHNIPDALVITLISDGKIIEANESFSRIAEFTKEEIMGKTTIELNLWSNLSDRNGYVEELQKHGKVLNFETSFRKKSGVLFAGLVSGETIQLQEGKCVLNVIRDISERKRTEQEIERLASFPRLNPNPVLEVDSTGRITYANEAVRAVLSALGLTDPRSFLPADIDELLLNIPSGMATAYQREITLAERVYSEAIHFTPAFHTLRIYATDITERKQAELELIYLSIHDALTGLYNRGHFEDTMARLERGRQFPVSIVMADVDGLKETNDREGHAAGDALLKRVVQVLTAAFRAEDILARIGGDEFAVILPNTDAAAAEAALRRLQRALQEHNAANAGSPVRLSFGASTAEKRAPLTDVLKEADKKMYREKRGHDVP